MKLSKAAAEYLLYEIFSHLDGIDYDDMTETEQLIVKRGKTFGFYEKNLDYRVVRSNIPKRVTITE